MRAHRINKKRKIFVEFSKILFTIEQKGGTILKIKKLKGNTKMKLLYQTHERPTMGKNLIFALQQLLAIIAATVLVPVLVDPSATYLSQASALIGAGVGTLIYLALTKFRSPVFLGSSFAFIAPLCTGVMYGYCGVILGSIFAGSVYVIIALLVKKFGTQWIAKLMPPVIIGPTVALIGLSLSGSALNNVMNVAVSDKNYNLLYILVGIATFLVTVIASTKGGKSLRMFPFVIGVLGGYVLASLITVFGYHIGGVDYCKIVDFSVFATIGDFSNWLPNITIVGAIGELVGAKEMLLTGPGVLTILIAFAPVALVTFAEHVADHKNISTIIERDLLEDPGLDRTLLGDGLGSIGGALMGGCPNTSYGESVGCVAITRNASIFTIMTTAILCIVLAFFYPVMAFIYSIPACIVGGISIALYGFIAVSGLRMFRHVDLDNTKNLYVVASIFVPGIGGLVLKFGDIQITSIACALILGILTNLMLGKKAEANEDKQ